MLHIRCLPVAGRQNPTEKWITMRKKTDELRLINMRIQKYFLSIVLFIERSHCLKLFSFILNKIVKSVIKYTYAFKSILMLINFTIYHFIIKCGRPLREILWRQKWWRSIAQKSNKTRLDHKAKLQYFVQFIQLC